MAKRRYNIDEKKIARYIKEGRGQGTGKAYKPWLTIQDVPSDGRSHRPLGWKTDRVHQLLSDIEYRFFLILNWSTEVTDIREQFPLDRKKTERIAAALSVLHPRQPGESAPMVMTTDFLVVTGRQTSRALVALSAKAEADLEDARVVEKLEIERRFWQEQDVPFCLCVDTMLPMTFVANLDSIYSAWDLTDMTESYKGYFDEYRNRVFSWFPAPNDTRPLDMYCTAIDERFDAEPGTALLMVKHLVAHRRLIVDMTRDELRKLPVAAFVPAVGIPSSAKSGAAGSRPVISRLRQVGNGE